MLDPRPLAAAVLLAAPALGSQLPPLLTLDGDEPGLRLGVALDGAGDVDGDGVPDLVVGASVGAGDATDVGHVSVLSGATGDELWTFVEPHAGDAFGAALAGAGDVDGDGRADVIVGARYDDTFDVFAGSATVFSGADGSVLHTWLGDEAGDRLGNAVDGAGDVDGDGFDDVIVGSFFDNTVAFWAGAARVFSGKDGKLLFEFLGEEQFHYLGTDVAGAGDVDGDGVPDLLVSTNEDDTNGANAGMARVYSGADGGALFTFYGDAQGDRLGQSVDGAGDVDGDGHADLVVGAWRADDGANADAGLVRVLSGLDGSVLFEARGAGAGHHLGYSVAGAGDLDGDGLADVVAGADFDDAGGGTPLGSLRAYSPARGVELKLAFGQEPNARFGLAVAGAGDVDGDGLADLLVGAPYHDAGGMDAGRFELHRGIGAVGLRYCSPAVPNSTGAPAELAAYGSQVVDANRLVLVASALPPNQFGYFLVGESEGLVVGPGGSQGNLCLAGALGRFADAVASSGAEGRLELTVDLTALPLTPPHTVLAGETWRFQAWFRDANPGPTSNFTDAVALAYE